MTSSQMTSFHLHCDWLQPHKLGHFTAHNSLCCGSDQSQHRQNEVREC